MSLQVTRDVSAPALSGYDLVIDVRSPAEFAEDHIPGAVNLPALSNAERAEVGTIYVQESRFKARKLGAAYVARNVAHHIETALADKGGGFRPLVYCWRGGMRSHATATILSEIGWRTTVVEGGYHTYRRTIIERLYDGVLSHSFVLLDGQTGTGKTEVLQRVAALGLQTLDLEEIAEHRGSLFGSLGRPQPRQRLFESRLMAALDALDPSRPIVAEAESSKIGDRMIPPALWNRLLDAPRIELVAEPDDRARYLAETYREITADRAGLEALFERLPVQPSPKRLAAWRALIDAGEYAQLARALTELHYDPAYERGRKKLDRPLLGTVGLDPNVAPSQAAAAEIVAGLVSSLDAPSLGRESYQR